MTFAQLFILDGSKRPVPCRSIITWGKWRRAHDCVLAIEEAGEAIVRTTFLGIDVQVLDDGSPVMFSSEAFLAIDHRKSEATLESRFYESYEQALAGHAELVEAFSKVAGIIMGDKQ